ncbi:hypothetical protein Tco_0191379 [Tanacetum coccineum]
MNKKNYSFDLETFRDMLQICPNLPGQKFEDPPFEEDILAFIRELSYPRDIKSISYVKFDTLYQPWRTFGTIINKCLSGKVTGLDQLRLSRAQIIWGMYHQKNVDYVYLLWEDLVYQIENKVSKKNKDMYYPRFTKVIINHFMSKDQSITRKNKVDWHMANNDPILTTMRFIPKHETVQKYGAILPDTLTNQAMKESYAYKTYHDFATGKVIPKPKYVRRSTREKTDQAPTASPVKRLKVTAKVAKSGKKKLPAQGLETLSEIALSEAEQMKIVTKRSKTQFHSSHASGSGADEGIGVTPGVPDVPTYGSEDEMISWKSSDEDEDNEVSLSKDDDDNDDNKDDDGQDDDNEQTESDMMVMTFFIPSSPLMMKKKDNMKKIKKKRGEELDEEEPNEEDEVNELYRDVNVNLEGRDTEMTNALLANVQTTQVIEDTHVIITAITPEVQQQSSSVSSGFISNMLIPNPDTGIDSILNLNTESTSLVDFPVTMNVEMPPSSVTTLPPPPIPQQQTPVSTPTIVPSTSLKFFPTFGSLFKFKDKVKALEDDFLEFKKTNLFAEAVSLIPGILDTYPANKMNEAIKTVVQLQSDRLRYEAQSKSEDFINKIDENIKKFIKKQVKVQVKEQVTKILPRIEKSVNEQLEAEVLIRSSNEAKTSYAVAANLSELDLKKILIDKIENNKSMTDQFHRRIFTKHWLTLMNLTKTFLHHMEILSRLKDVEMMRMKTKNPLLDQTGGPRDEELERNLTEEPIHADEDLEEPTHQEFDTGFTVDQPVDETTQHPHCTLAWNEDPRKSFNELIDTHLDFSAFVLNRLKVDTLTPELLAGPTFELIKGSCKSLVELEYYLEEVCKATTDQLDWNNPEGQQYPHDLRNPLPLIPNSRVTKTKAADYEHIKWIEDLVPNTMWINRESARDVYSRNRIIGIKKLTIVEWHNYKHLEWITICRDDDKLYTFKKGDYNRLRLKDIEDMLLLLVHGKLTNLNIKERLALGVSLRMFTTNIVIISRVKDLQLGIESYQKKLNLIKLDTFMRIDELYKFSDGTLNDVRSTLDDILKRIQMEYLPQTVWRNVDRERAGVMI